MIPVDTDRVWDTFSRVQQEVRAMTRVVERGGVLLAYSRLINEDPLDREVRRQMISEELWRQFNQMCHAQRQFEMAVNEPLRP